MGASVFTTLSTTTILEKIREQIRTETPEPATFDIGISGALRAVFPVSGVASILAVRQTGTAPAFGAPTLVPLAGLQIVPGAVGQIAFGKFVSPNYLASPGEFIPTVGTRSGEPAAQGTEDIYFNLFLPAGPRPDAGWPVAIFGHGFGSHKDAAPFVLAAVMAQRGIATIAINVVGQARGRRGR